MATVIKTGDKITSQASERVKELKTAIEAIELPAIPRNVGDVVFYDNINNKIVFADANADFASEYPAEQYTPIGVVAVPNSHNVYGDNTNGVVSLKYMNYSTPDEGSVSSQNIYWGYNSKLLGDALDSCVTAGTIGEPTAEATGTMSSTYLPSDYIEGTVCPTDSKAFYRNDVASTNGTAPSPYLENEDRNPVYSQTEEPSSEKNCLADFDGVNKTQLMLDNVTVSNWQTASTISNSYSSGNYPSACCCWRFRTAGTEQGDWYLPAMGELGYMIVRVKAINASIVKLIEVYGDEIGSEMTGDIYFWSSTEYSSSYARFGGVAYGNVNANNKNNSSYVRAFARL